MGKLYLIEIPHKIQRIENILISPFHRWEHLYIRYINNLFSFSSVDCFGYTQKEKTCLIIQSVSVLPVFVIDFKRILQNFHVCEIDLRIEKDIINSEIAALAFLFNKKMLSCEEGYSSKTEDFYNFRKVSYNWKNLKVLEITNTTSKTSQKSSSPQEKLKKFRDILKYASTDKEISEITIKIPNNERYIWVFYQTKFENGEYQNKKKRIASLDSPKMRDNIIKRFGTYFFWPEISCEDTQGYISFFLCLREERLPAFKKMIEKEIIGGG